MIIFADFDGTVYPHDNGLAVQVNLDAIRSWREAGNQFCITTGRSIRSLMRQLPEIQELCDYFIMDSGSIILDHAGNTLKVFSFDPEIVTTITDFSKNLPELPAVVYYTDTSEGVEMKVDGVTKLRYWFKDTSLLEPIATELKNRFPVLAFEMIAPAPAGEWEGRNGFIEIIPRGLGKSNAIKYLKQLINIPTQDIVTVGDGLNDYDMIRDFDGYAMEGSALSQYDQTIKTTPSVAEMIATIKR